MKGSLECNLELVDSWGYGATSGFSLTTHFPSVPHSVTQLGIPCRSVGLRVKAEPTVISSIYPDVCHKCQSPTYTKDSQSSQATDPTVHPVLLIHSLISLYYIPSCQKGYISSCQESIKEPRISESSSGPRHSKAVICHYY